MLTLLLVITQIILISLTLKIGLKYLVWIWILEWMDPKLDISEEVMQMLLL